MTSETGRGNQRMAHPGLASAWLPRFSRRAPAGARGLWARSRQGSGLLDPWSARSCSARRPAIGTRWTARRTSDSGVYFCSGASSVARPACGISDPDTNVGRVRDRQRSQLAGEPPPFCPPRVAVQVLLSGTDGEHKCNAGRPALYWEDYRFAPKRCGSYCAIQVRLGFLPRSGFLPRPR
jgi:hypothetical protein